MEHDWVKLSDSFTTEIRAVFGTLCLILVLIGLLGNCFVCIIVFKTKVMQNSTNILIANLAIADFIQCLNIGTIAATLCSGEWLFGHVGCQISGYVMMTMVFVSLYLLGLISLNRFCYIKYPTKYHLIFTIEKTWMMVLSVWLVAFVASSPPLYSYGFATYVFRQRRCLCSMDFKHSYRYFVPFIFVSAMPVFLIIIFYWKIFRLVRNNHRRVQHVFQTPKNRSQYGFKIETSTSQVSLKIVENGRENGFSRRKTSHRTTSTENCTTKSCASSSSNAIVRTTVMLFVIMLIFFVVYTPAMVINTLEMTSPTYIPNTWLDLFFTMLAFSNHAINPVVYGFMNKQYKKAFKKYFLIC